MKRRLGAGDFVPAKAPNPYARMRYIQAVARCVPESFRALVALDPTDEALLRGWAERWGFTDDWALWAARLHAPVWREHPETIGTALIVSVTSWEPVFPAGPSWNPINEAEKAFRARVDAYIATMKAAPGIQPTPTKLDPDDRHFEWAALYHVAGQQQGAIIERYQEKYPDEYDGLMPGTVSEAIKRVASLIGLTLRPKQGRPRKT